MIESPYLTCDEAAVCSCHTLAPAEPPLLYYGREFYGGRRPQACEQCGRAIHRDDRCSLTEIRPRPTLICWPCATGRAGGPP